MVGLQVSLRWSDKGRVKVLPSLVANGSAWKRSMQVEIAPI